MSLQKTIDMMYVSLNRVRMEPNTQASYYQNAKRLYNGLIYRQNVKTRQGVNALQNLVSELQQRPPVNNKLKWSFALHMAADEQAIKLGDNGLITTQNTMHHVPLPKRCQQYGIIRGRLSEVYEFGGNSPQEILESLLIDDGLASRKRRKTLLDPIYNYVGIGTSFHEKYGTVTVIILAEDVISLVAPGDQGSYLRRENLPQGQKYVFDVIQERQNQLRRVQQQSFRNDSFYTNNSQSFNDSFGYNNPNYEYQNQRHHHHQNALKEHDWDRSNSPSRQKKQQSSCQIF